MSYDVSFKAKLEGAEQWVYVGADWINHTSNTANIIKEVCGSYPSQWDGKKCSELIPVLEQGIKLLTDNPQRYYHLEPENGWGTVQTTLSFLIQIANNCINFPTAYVEVDY